MILHYRSFINFGYVLVTFIYYDSKTNIIGSMFPISDIFYEIIFKKKKEIKHTTYK